MSNVLSVSDLALFREISLGDSRAFRLFFDRYRERIFTFVWQLCHSSADAEEIVQDIFMKLWQARETLAFVDSPKSYLYMMAKNRALNLLAKIARDKKLAEQAWANIVEFENYTDEVLDAKETVLLINAAIAQLPEKKQLIFQLSREGGLSHKEIAEQMHLSVQTVKNIMTEVLNFIRFMLAKHSEFLALICWIHFHKYLF